ncbi:MAG: hypothetical protein GX091_03270 [Peptococcaceae bacterium]|nr:hypothetical protein [Peptococcaceae bacterium]
MLVSMQMIADKIKHYNPKMYISQYSEPELTGVRLFSNLNCQIDSHYVYVIESHDIPKDIFDQERINIIIVGEVDFAENLMNNPNHNVIIIGGQYALEDIFNEILNIFNFFNDFEKKLQESLIHKKGIKDLLDISYSVFNNPMYIIDPAFMTITWSKRSHTGLEDYQWKSIVENGHTDQQLIDHHKATMMGEYLNKQRKAVIFTSEKFSYRTICSNLWIKDKRFGRLSVLEIERPFNDSDLYLVDFLTKFLCIAVQNDEYYQRTHGTLYKYFIIDQITGKNYDKKLIGYNLKQLNWKADDPYYVLKVHVTAKDIANSTLEYHGTLISRMFFGSRFIIYEDTIIIVINANKCIASWDNAVNSLRDFLKKNGLKGGMSCCFNNFYNLNDYYKLASACVELGSQINPEETLYFFEDYAIFHMIRLCSEKYDLTMFCHPKAMKIYKYDQRNKTDYLFTIYTYILKEKNIVATSKKLGIHRNSLVYRIKRINELFQVDLDNLNEEIHFILSYKIIEYMQRN